MRLGRPTAPSCSGTLSVTRPWAVGVGRSASSGVPAHVRVEHSAFDIGGGALYSFEHGGFEHGAMWTRTSWLKLASQLKLRSLSPRSAPRRPIHVRVGCWQRAVSHAECQSATRSFLPSRAPHAMPTTLYQVTRSLSH